MKQLNLIRNLFSVAVMITLACNVSAQVSIRDRIQIMDRDIFNYPESTDAPVKTKPVTKQDEPPKEFALPPRNVDDRRVFAYLRKRGIAAQVIRQFMNSGSLYEDAVHHNCVFVGRDHTGQAGYAGLRGTYDRDGKGFRGDVSGSRIAAHQLRQG